MHAEFEVCLKIKYILVDLGGVVQGEYPKVSLCGLLAHGR